MTKNCKSCRPAIFPLQTWLRKWTGLSSLACASQYNLTDSARSSCCAMKMGVSHRLPAAVKEEREEMNFWGVSEVQGLQKNVTYFSLFHIFSYNLKLVSLGSLFSQWRSIWSFRGLFRASMSELVYLTKPDAVSILLSSNLPASNNICCWYLPRRDCMLITKPPKILSKSSFLKKTIICRCLN